VAFGAVLWVAFAVVFGVAFAEVFGVAFAGAVSLEAAAVFVVLPPVAAAVREGEVRGRVVEASAAAAAAAARGTGINRVS